VQCAASQCYTKAHIDRRSTRRKAQFVRCSERLQREMLGFCTGGSKGCEKAQAGSKSQSGDITTH